MPYVGEVRIWAPSNLVPTGWALCNGQILSIGSNTALFQVIGTAYGGDGASTFALPDLRGRVPVQPGQGQGLTNRTRGESGGTESHTLGITHLPGHTHTLRASTANGSSDSPGGAPARNPAGIPQFAASADADLAAGAVASAGGGQPHNNMQPYIAVNHIIALQGMFPTP
jgi:microcystin-dependent protein